jgi:hypothetical protein
MGDKRMESEGNREKRKILTTRNVCVLPETKPSNSSFSKVSPRIWSTKLSSASTLL